MAITKFIPEIWSAALLSVLDKSLVFGGVANRDYEGEISAYGDTVHITNLDDPTISDYTRNTDLADVETLTDDEQLLLIDQSKAFNFQLDDLDAAQARSGGAVMNEATRRAGFKLRDKADQFLAAKMAGAAGNTLGVIDGTTASNVYEDLLVPASVKLDEADVPEEMRWIIVAPAAYGKLQLDDRFIDASKSANAAALHNGFVGMGAGFRIYKSNNASQANRQVTAVTTASGAKTLTGVAGQFNQGDVGLSVAGTCVGASAKVVSVNADGSVATVDVNSSASASVTVTLSGGGQLAYAGSSISTTYAEQINKVEAYRPEKRFADALKGLHLYGAKVVRPEALVVASVKTA
jgi:N4-gp56 family major capsid protein